MARTERITKASHPVACALMTRVFPQYRGRKFRLTIADRARINDYWDGGSRSYAAFVDLATGRTVGSGAIPQHLRQQVGNWFNLPMADVPLDGTVAVVEHHIFCGKDAGLELTVAPAMAARVLPAGPAMLAEGAR